MVPTRAKLLPVATGGQAQVGTGTVGSCGRCRWCGQSSNCRGDPVGPKRCLHAVLPLLGATNGVHQGQMAVCGHWGGRGRVALLPLVATMGAPPQAAGVGEPQWGQGSAPMWGYLCWMPPVGCTRPRWQPLATRGAVVCRGTAGPCGHYGWFTHSCRCWGAPVGGTMWWSLCLVPLVVHTRAKCQCVATRGAVPRLALLALAATMDGLHQAAGVGEPQWVPNGVTMWWHSGWQPAPVCTRAKWQLVATGGQGGSHKSECPHHTR